MRKKILIADDHGIVRMGLIMLLKKILPHTDVLESSDYAEVIELAKTHSFDLYILDATMPNGNFQSTFNFIKSRHPESKVLVFSSLDEQIYAMRYIQEGADGFLNKLAGEEELKKALNTIFSNKKYLSDSLKDTLVFSKQDKDNSKNKLAQLSNREISIGHMLIKGYSLKRISSELSLHVSTVSTYKMRIFEKLNISTIPELIKIFDLAN